MNRRAFLGLVSGSLAAPPTFSLESGPRPSPVSSAKFGHSAKPPFGGPDSSHPHTIAWGGNWLYGLGKGFERTTHERREESIISMHPDQFWLRGIIAFNGPPSETFDLTAVTRGQLEFALRHGYRSPLGRTGEFGTTREAEWYQGLPEEDKWRWPDGSIVRSHSDVVVRHPDGSPWKNEDRLPEGEYTFMPSLHVDGVQEFFDQVAVDFVRLGSNGIWIDGNWAWKTKDYSVWAVDAFRDHLGQLESGELDHLGVEDPESIDVVDELTSRTAPFSDDHPATDPLYREFTKHDYRTQKQFFASLRDTLQEEFPGHEDDFVVFGNLGDPLVNPHITAILSDPLTFPSSEAQSTVPPEHIYDFETKFFAAADRYQQTGFHMGPPLWFEEPTEAIFDSDMDLGEIQPDFLAVHYAEQIANRTIGVANFQGDCCPLSRPIQEQPGNWLRPDGSLAEPLAELTAFSWATREVLRDGDFAHDVAVVSSIPANLWNSGSHVWKIDNEHIRTSFGGAANIVLESQRPYDVLIFGHPDLWDDGAMLERLSTYRQVVLPSVVCLSDAQRAALLEALDEGVHVIITGEQPTRDEDYELLSPGERNDVLEHPNATVLSDSPGREYWNETGNGSSLRRALADRDPLVRTNAASNLEITIQTHSDPERVVIQTVNYAFDLDAGDAVPVEALELDVADTFGPDLDAANYYRPGADVVALDPNQSGDRVTVTLPELEVWGVLVLGPDDQTVALAGNADASGGAIAAAREAISTAETEQRSSGLETAEYFLEYAQDAARYDAHERAEEAARKAQRAAEASRSPPTVGIDSSHNQPDAGHPYGFFDALRESFFEPVTFTEVTEWSEAVFADLDVLIVPPTYEHQGGPFEFTEADATLLEEFVKRGGGVLFLAQGGIARDHTAVTAPFDLAFEPGPVRREGHWGSEEVRRRATHQINRTVLEMSDVGPSAVVNPPEDATVLFEYPAEAGVWREVCGDSQRQDCDVDASGEPFSVVRNYGLGTVMLHGSMRHVRPPSWVTDFERPWTNGVSIQRNAILYMAGRAKEATDRTPTATTDSPEADRGTAKPESPTGPATPERTQESSPTSTTVPGFTMVITVVGILGALTARILWDSGLDDETARE